MVTDEMVETACRARISAQWGRPLVVLDWAAVRSGVEEKWMAEALAAVLPEIQAQALESLRDEFKTWHVYDTRDMGDAFSSDLVIEEVEDRIAELRATTTEEPTPAWSRLTSGWCMEKDHGACKNPEEWPCGCPCHTEEPTTCLPSLGEPCGVCHRCTDRKETTT